MQIRLGTVTVANGSATVISSFNDLTDQWAGIFVGAYFVARGQSATIVYQIADLISPAVSASTFWEIVLSANYQGESADEVEYVIFNDFTPEFGLLLMNKGDVESAAIFSRAMLTLEETMMNRVVSLVNGLIPTFKLPVIEATTNGTFAVDKRIAGLTANDSTKKVYGTYDHTGGGNYVRSDTCWASNLNVSAISVWNSATGNGDYPVTAITPRHIALAYHVTELIDGTQFRFVDTDGNIITRTMISSARVSVTDLKIGKLDSDLPDSVVPLEVLNTNHQKFIELVEMPLVVIDRERKALVYDCTGTGAGIASANAQRLTFTKTLVTGDSSSPGMIVQDERLVLLFALTGAGPNGASIYAAYAATNAVLTSLGGGYQLTQSAEIGRTIRILTSALAAGSLWQVTNTGTGPALTLTTFGPIAFRANGVSYLNGGLECYAETVAPVKIYQLDDSYTNPIAEYNNFDGLVLSISNEGCPQLLRIASAPPNPPSGFLKLWAKTDGTFHILTSAGVDKTITAT